MCTIKETLHNASTKLASISESAQLDAEILVCFALSKMRSYLLTWPDEKLTMQQQKKFQAALEQRLTGKPIAYITGIREFWSLDFLVNEHTLIPRPDTELLVELALTEIKQNASKKIIDLGTGSGCIAISIAKEHPEIEVHASDQSLEALNIAQQNAIKHHTKKINFHHSNWFATIPTIKYDIIISNPPYIEQDDQHLTQGDVQFEPKSALSAGHDGLDDIRTLITQAPNYLAEGGILMLEHGYQQAAAVRQLLHNNTFSNIVTQRDLAKNERVTSGRLSKLAK